MAIDFKGWVKQPTTIHGIGAIVSLGVAFLVYYVTHNTSWSGSAAVMAFGAVCMALPDASVDKSSVEKLATDAIQAIVSQRTMEMFPVIAGDVMKVMQVPAAPAVKPVPESSETH